MNTNKHIKSQIKTNTHRKQKIAFVSPPLPACHRSPASAAMPMSKSSTLRAVFCIIASFHPYTHPSINPLPLFCRGTGFVKLPNPPPGQIWIFFCGYNVGFINMGIINFVLLQNNGTKIAKHGENSHNKMADNAKTTRKIADSPKKWLKLNLTETPKPAWHCAKNSLKVGLTVAKSAKKWSIRCTDFRV